MFKFFRATNIFITKPGEALIVHTILLYHKPISDCITYQIDFCKILVKRILAKNSILVRVTGIEPAAS